jgi:hypothetical protein
LAVVALLPKTAFFQAGFAIGDEVAELVGIFAVLQPKVAGFRGLSVGAITHLPRLGTERARTRALIVATIILFGIFLFQAANLVTNATDTDRARFAVIGVSALFAGLDVLGSETGPPNLARVTSLAAITSSLLKQVARFGRIIAEAHTNEVVVVEWVVLALLTGLKTLGLVVVDVAEAANFRADKQTLEAGLTRVIALSLTHFTFYQCTGGHTFGGFLI